MKLEPKCVMGLTEHMIPEKLNIGMHYVTEQIMDSIIKQLDEMFIEGLRRKGFEFMDRKDVEEFIRHNCRCEDNVHHKEKVYYVYNVPFLIEDYSIETSFNFQNTDRNIMVSAESNRYRFV